MKYHLNLISKANSGASFANMCFILASGLAFFYYSLSSGKYFYILVAAIIYLIGWVSRTRIIKAKYSDGVTESGMVFIAAALLGYILYLLKLDPDIYAYLPNTLIVGSAVCYIVLIAMQFISNIQSLGSIIILGVLIYVLNLYKHIFDNFIYVNPQIVGFIVGMPILYLAVLTLGLNKFKYPNN